MEVQGKIKLVGNVQEITDSFKKREIIIVTQEQYPQTLCIDFVQEKIDSLISDIVNRDRLYIDNNCIPYKHEKVFKYTLKK